MDELSYTQGAQSVYRWLLAEALRGLYDDEPELAARWAIERADAVATLRQVCSNFGDNDWADDLHLSDIIEKHLAWHLSRNIPKEQWKGVQLKARLGGQAPAAPGQGQQI